MARHRGTYKPENSSPFELSRGAIENLVKCEACFWLEKVKGIKPPKPAGYNLNTNTDTLLKRDFDAHRGIGPHPLMEAAGLGHLRPFAHPNMDKWIAAPQFGAAGHFHIDHEETNIRFGGGVDDVWENIETGELHIVDYKSTAQLAKEPKPIDASFIAPPEEPAEKDYKASYRRQMDMYQWIARRMGFEVSDTGFFVYVDGQHVGESGMLIGEDPWQAWMRFNVSVISYEADDSWVESALAKAKNLVSSVDVCPDHAADCDYGTYLTHVAKATAVAALNPEN